MIASTPERRFRTLIVALVATAAAIVAGCSATDKDQIAAFNQMAANPDQALDFLYPDGLVEPGTSPVAVDYIKERDWTDDEFDALANMLDAAATAHRTTDDPRAPLSALAASDTINLLATRPSIPNTANDSLAHILATYIVDVSQLARVEVPCSTGDESLASPIFAGLPQGARFNRRAVEAILAETLTGGDAIAQIANATHGLAELRISNEIEGENTDAIDAAASDATELMGFVIAAQRASSAKTDSERDAESEYMVEIVGAGDGSGASAANLQELIANQATVLGEDFVATTPASDPGIVQPGTNYYLMTANDFTVTLGIQLGEAGLLTDAPNGNQPYPWFVGESFDAAAASDNQVAFITYLQGPESGWGETMTDAFDNVLYGGRLQRGFPSMGESDYECR